MKVLFHRLNAKLYFKWLLSTGMYTNNWILTPSTQRSEQQSELTSQDSKTGLHSPGDPEGYPRFAPARLVDKLIRNYNTSWVHTEDGWRAFNGCLWGQTASHAVSIGVDVCGADGGYRSEGSEDNGELHSASVRRPGWDAACRGFITAGVANWV